ncbi:MAG: glucose-6-phosphate isomerase [Nevskia sp.]|nr:glucose-6-phosphate isomerase [Nevskia sp.]
MSNLTQSPAWRALQDHARTWSGRTLLDLFAQDVDRAASLSASGAGLFLDYSKQRVDARTLELLLAFAEQQQLQGWIARMFSGALVNDTEQRAALHVALRAPRAAQIFVGGTDVVPRVHGVLDRMSSFADAVRSGFWTGETGARITDIVNIGIGGSDLGPRMVCEALAPAASGPRAHFVANVDGAQIAATLRGLKPASTLFVVASKVFTTQETLANAHTARHWLVSHLGEGAVERHFVAVSTNLAEVRKFGIAPANMFEFWDWVGGRYSLWSAIGLPIMLAYGPALFRELLAGAHAMDQHFSHAPPAQNLPVLLGLLGVWNSNFLATGSQVIAPYAQRLERFVGWVQQLEMESNGKAIDREGMPVDYATTPVLWGDVGTNAQHAFFQMLHQGPITHAVDFILPVTVDHEYPDQHRLLIANCLAQSAALMRGKDAGAVRAELQAQGLSGDELDKAIPHRVFRGNRPSNTLLLPRLDAYHLGALLALYEHRTFVQSVLWNINAFDQWGVELGKQLAQSVLRAIDDPASVDLDGSTRALLARLRP